MRLKRRWMRFWVAYEYPLPILLCRERHGVEMDPPPGRTWADPLGPRRQHPFRLCPPGKRGHLPYRALGAPPGMVDLLRTHGNCGRSAWRLSDLQVGQKRRPTNFGKENRETAGRENLQTLREAWLPDGIHWRSPAAAIPVHFRPHDRRRHAVSTQELLFCAGHGSRPAFFCCRLSGQDLWPRNDRLLLAALPDDDVRSDRAGSDGRHRRPGLFQMVPAQGAT